MTPIRVNLSHIRSLTILCIPSVVITGKEFQYANIAWVQTADGGDYEIVFDQRGEPLVDAGLIKRLAAYYEKKFVAILFNGRAAYAQVNETCKNHGQTRTADAGGKMFYKGSNPNHS